MLIYYPKIIITGKQNNDDVWDLSTDKKNSIEKIENNIFCPR